MTVESLSINGALVRCKKCNNNNNYSQPLPARIIQRRNHCSLTDLQANCLLNISKGV